jgi:serine/threonine-protein kinase
MNTAPLTEPIHYGKYTLFERLGAGGMAEVFLARQDGAGGFAKKVVIKRILGDYAHDNTFVEMFLAEARLAAHLSHPNIVQIFDMGQEGETYFIAMEYVAGPNLLHLLRYATLAKDPRPTAFAKIASGVAEGLYYAHNANGPDGLPLKIVHRDINPPNIIVSTEGIPKICDFGVAKSTARESTTGSNLKGKYTYMAPEQIKGEKVDHRADLFSLGVVLFETTTNKRLFKRDTELQVLNAVLQDPIPAPSLIVKGYPTRLEQIVMWCLERDREKRCPDARTLHNALEDYLRNDPLGMTQVQLGEWVRSVLPAEVRDSVSGQYGFYSLPANTNIGRERTPTGWTPSQMHSRQAIENATRPPSVTPSPSPISKAGTPPGGRVTGLTQSKRTPLPGTAGAAAGDGLLTRSQPGLPSPSTGEAFPVLEGEPHEPTTQPFTLPDDTRGIMKWVALGGSVVVGLAAVFLIIHIVGSKPTDMGQTAGGTSPITPTGATGAGSNTGQDAPKQNPEEAAKFYTDEAKRLIGAGKYGPAAVLVAKAKELNPQSPQTNVAIAELEEESEVGARLAAARQALADGDYARVSSLAKLVLDKEPTQAAALDLLHQAKAKLEPTSSAPKISNNSHANKPGVLSVDAPPGSRVYVDDEPIGQAPISHYSLAVGRHRVEVRRDGFRPEVHEVKMESNGQEHVVARMDAKEEVRVALATVKDVPVTTPPEHKSSSSSEPDHGGGAGVPSKPPENANANEHTGTPTGLAATPTSTPPTPSPTASNSTASTSNSATAPTPSSDPPKQAPVPTPAPGLVGEVLTDQMVKPQKISGDDVRYSAEALKVGSKGLVLAKCAISELGSVHDCKIIKGVPFMDQPVLDALQSWKMKPATLDGKPVALRSYTFTINLVAPK